LSVITVVSNRQGPTSRMGIPDHIGDRWSDRYLGCFTGLVWVRLKERSEQTFPQANDWSGHVIDLLLLD
jgi:hypothetical protein